MLYLSHPLANVGLFCLILLVSIYLIFGYWNKAKKVIAPFIPNSKKSLDDGSLVVNSRRNRNLMVKQLSQSVLWLKDKAKKTAKKIMPSSKSGGDGLRSIYTHIGSNPSSSGPFHISITNDESYCSSICESTFNENQKFAFSALYESGIFEGAEITVLNDVCATSSVISLKKGDTVFSETELCNTLYVLKSGRCQVRFQFNDSEAEAVHEIEPGLVIASHLDTIAWITGCKITRGFSVVCVEDSEIVQIPTLTNSFKLRVHLTAFSRIVRMLLSRINRTTVTTSLFYLGLAEHFLPSFRIVKVPDSLISACECSRTKEQLQICLIGSLNEVVIDCIKDLYGIVNQDIDVDVSVDILVPKSLIHADLSTPSKDFVAPEPISASAFPSKQNSDIESAFEDDELRRPSPLLRGQSFDSTLSPALNLDMFKVKGANPGGRVAAKKIQTKLFLLKKGQTITDIDEVPGLYIVVSGDLQMKFCGKSRGNKKSDIGLGMLGRQSYVSNISTGSVIGHIALLSGTSEEWYGCKNDAGSPLLVVTACSEQCWLLCITMDDYLLELINKPSIIFHVSSRLIEAMPPVLRLFDFCTKWKKVEGGKNVVVKGQPPLGELLVVLCGRLGVVHVDEAATNKSKFSGDYVWSSPAPTSPIKLKSDREGRENVSDEKEQTEPDFILGKGALIGEIQLLTGENYKYTVRAMRQTSLASVPLSLLNFIAQRYPSVLAYIARNVSDKRSASYTSSSLSEPSNSRQSQALMIVPISGSVPFDLVVSTLHHCLSQYANKVRFVTSADVAPLFGGSLDNISESEAFLTIGSWLHEIEVDTDIIVYQADWQYSLWNRLCVSICDEIVLVGNSMDDPSICEVEESLAENMRFIPKTLVILHVNPSHDLEPTETRRWIEKRANIRRHVQVRLNSRHLPFDKFHHRSDFHRLARILTNNAIGLVLGGGGARGFAQLGIIQVLEEKGIPIDFIGGTSIGAFIGGLYASEQSFVKIVPIAKKWSNKLASVWFFIQDLTLPITSYFNGFSFSSAIREVFKRRKIEDFWLNYYCITTDLTSHSELIHVNGTASRYIRASMSLANLLPPLSDYDHRDKQLHFLVDGGYVNTVPVDVMKRMFGASLIFAVDVSSDWTIEADHNYGENVSGLSVFISKWNPFAKTKTVPSMADIGTQIAFISACKQMEKAREIADLFLSPPIHSYTALDFGKFEELKQLGFDYGKATIEPWFENFMKSEKSDKFKWLVKKNQLKQNTEIEIVKS